MLTIAFLVLFPLFFMKLMIVFKGVTRDRNNDRAWSVVGGVDGFGDN